MRNDGSSTAAGLYQSQGQHEQAIRVLETWAPSLRRDIALATAFLANDQDDHAKALVEARAKLAA